MTINRCAQSLTPLRAVVSVERAGQNLGLRAPRLQQQVPNLFELGVCINVGCAILVVARVGRGGASIKHCWAMPNNVITHRAAARARALAVGSPGLAMTCAFALIDPTSPVVAALGRRKHGGFANRRLGQAGRLLTNGTVDGNEIRCGEKFLQLKVFV